MGTSLIDGWLGADDGLPIFDEASVSVARQRAREVAAAQGLGDADAARLATIASELGHNLLRHALGGRLEVRPLERRGYPGVEIVSVDRGGGIEDPRRALAGIPKNADSLGAGLSAVRNLADEVDFDVRLGEGTHIAARKLASGAPRHRQVGAFGRPIRSESRSGDHAGVRRDQDVLVVAVCDGLGHGPEAREASLAMMAAFHQCWREPPADVIEACHRAGSGTRGAVMAIARVEEATGDVDVASVGNVSCEFLLPREGRRVEGSSFVLGSPQKLLKVTRHRRTLRPGEALMLFTDGVTARASVAEDLALLREPPIVVAREVATRFGRDHDDVLVLVLR
jgi:anti-sigma regulatory factor (Ser/Thr protein kinase)